MNNLTREERTLKIMQILAQSGEFTWYSPTKLLTTAIETTDTFDKLIAKPVNSVKAEDYEDIDNEIEEAKEELEEKKRA